MAHPSIPLTDKRFVYTHSTKTNLAEKFKAIRAAQEAAAKSNNVKPMRKAK